MVMRLAKMPGTFEIEMVLRLLIFTLKKPNQ